MVAHSLGAHATRLAWTRTKLATYGESRTAQIMCSAVASMYTKPTQQRRFTAVSLKLGDVGSYALTRLRHAVGPALGKPGTYYGYPYCFSVWDPAAFPEDNFKPGDWFVQQPNDTINDAFCNANAVKPTLLIPPHSAPLDMTFGQGHDSNLYGALHTSHDQTRSQAHLWRLTSRFPRLLEPPASYRLQGCHLRG